MKISNEEMMFMLSVSRGRKPLGIHTIMPSETERETYIRSTIQSLNRKGIVDNQEKLTKEGVDLISFLEQYRNNHRHVAIDNIFIAVLPEDRLITVQKTEEGYEFSCISTGVLLGVILKYSEYLRSEEKVPQRGKWQNINIDGLIEKARKSDGGVWVREYMDGKLEEEKFYGWNKEEGYVVNLDSYRMRTLSPGIMRRQLYGLFREEE